MESWLQVALIAVIIMGCTNSLIHHIKSATLQLTREINAAGDKPREQQYEILEVLRKIREDNHS